MKLQRRIALEAQADTLRASISSEAGVDRGEFVEVLSHDPAAVDLSRAKDGLPWLFDHRTDRPIGRAHDVRLDGKRLVAELEPGTHPDAEMARSLLETGHRELSIGYIVTEWQQEGTLMSGKPLMVATRWTPFEVSLVSVPADAGIGVGRSLHLPKKGNAMQTPNTPQHMTRSQRRGEASAHDLQTIAAIGEQFRAHGGVELAMEAMRQGDNLAVFRERLMDKLASFSRPTGDYGSSYQTRSFSLAAAIASHLDPASGIGGYEREISQELTRSSGVRSEGLMVPMSAIFGGMHRSMNLQRNLFTGTPSLGGSTVQTTIDGTMFVDVLRAKSQVVNLGARVLTGLSDTLSMPRKTAATTVGWVTETGQVASSDPATDNVTLAPKRVGAYTDVSRQLMIQAAVDVENMITTDLAESILLEVDRVALLGTGASNMPRGILSTSGVGTVVGGTNGATLNYSHILDLEKVVAAANAQVDVTSCGYIINPATRAFLKRTPKVAGNVTVAIMDDDPPSRDGVFALNGYAAAVTTKLSAAGTKGTVKDLSTLVFGDWSQLVIGQFGPGVELIVDQFSLAREGQVRIVAHLFVDVAVRHPESFSYMTDAATA